MKKYTKKEIAIANKLLKFLSVQIPEKEYCNSIEPDICYACREKLAIVRFFNYYFKSRHQIK